MTWAKYDTGFFAQCADAGLSDAATLTHAQAVHWLYMCDRKNVMDMSIPTTAIPRFATSADWPAGVAQLLRVGFWAELEDNLGYALIHHAEVIRQSLTAQRVKKERDRKLAAARRAKEAAGKGVASDVGSDVGHDVRGDTYIHTEHPYTDVGSQLEQLPDGGWSETSVAQPGQLASVKPNPIFDRVAREQAEKETAA